MKTFGWGWGWFEQVKLLVKIFLPGRNWSRTAFHCSRKKKKTVNKIRFWVYLKTWTKNNQDRSHLSLNKHRNIPAKNPSNEFLTEHLEVVWRVFQYSIWKNYKKTKESLFFRGIRSSKLEIPEKRKWLILKSPELLLAIWN